MMKIFTKMLKKEFLFMVGTYFALENKRMIPMKNFNCTVIELRTGNP